MRALAWILAEDVLTFAYSDDSEVTDDFAVAQLERISLSLKTAGAATLRLFLETVREMGEEARMQGDTERASRLASMPVYLGLTSYRTLGRAGIVGSI